MAGRTNQIVVTDAAWLAVTTEGNNTNSVVVAEAPDPTVVNSPTTAYYIAKPSSLATPITVAIGVSYSFAPPAGWSSFPDAVIGYIRLVAGGGSTTFNKDVR